MKYKGRILLFCCLFGFFFILFILSFQKSYSVFSSELTDEQINSIENGTLKLTYELFGAVGDGKTNDYGSIKKTHDFANNLYLSTGKLVTVYGSSGKTYYIGECSDTIDVITNVDWQNANFIIDDFVDNNNDNINDINIKEPVFNVTSPLLVATKNTTKTSYVQLSSVESEENVENRADDYIIQSLNNTSTQTNNLKVIVDEVSKAKYSDPTGIVSKFLKSSKRWAVELQADHKQYIRTGVNSNSSSAQKEQIIIDSVTGDVLSDITWDYSQAGLNRVRVIPIPNQEIFIQNGNFLTYTYNCVFNNNANRSSYTKRGIKIEYTGNVTLKNINHSLDESRYKYTSNYQDIDEGNIYYGFIYLNNAYFINLENIKLTPHKMAHLVQNKEILNSSFVGTYDLVMDHSANIFADNIGYYCSSGDDQACYADYMLDNSTRWGLIATNRIKNLFITNSKLNRVDSHTGVHNLYLENTLIGSRGLTLIGHGYMYAKNITVDNAFNIVHLRGDYGSTWDGTLVFDGVNYKTDQFDAANFIYSTNAGNHDYGYYSYFPNVYLRNFNGQVGSQFRQLRMFRLTDTIGVTKDDSNDKNLYRFKDILSFSNINLSYGSAVLSKNSYLVGTNNLLLSTYGPLDNSLKKQVSVSIDDTISFNKSLFNENTKFKIQNVDSSIYNDIITIFSDIKSKSTMPVSNNNGDDNESIYVVESVIVDNTSMNASIISIIFGLLSVVCGCMTFVYVFKSHILNKSE